ncbi:MAG TPA: uracil permease [Firmicutes bacterium]|uniref:uracil permease n=1 Tax=Gelria sp. Kuro-4 TaxID=2796927 RepID=UPI001986A376|nr:uracil permease [Gelria sp. Kuro-4]BCV24732.1 uracil transporter [Gelria sp. Kuro-4]HHV57033.1 uracil permease [Bacillota bacterium]
MRRIINPEERLPLLTTLPLSIQHLFAMFGATILVPILTGLHPSVALLGSGLGTFTYIICTRGKIPAYLGSSFAFIVPIIVASKYYGVPAALGGCLVAGLVYVAVAAVIHKAGTGWLDRLLPPVVVGSVVIVIGLALARTAVDMAGLLPKDGQTINLLTSPGVWTAMFTLAVAVIASVYLKGILNVIPILIGILAGYGFAFTQGLVDLTPVLAAEWFALPPFVTPRFSLPAVLLIAPVAVVSITEHIGHLLVTNNIVGRDFTKDPGLDRSILGDGLATSLAALFGAPPNTTYGENIGVMAITRVYSVWVIGWAAAIAVVLSFVQKLGVAIQTIPTPVLGGISILLFGTIAAAGVRMLVESQVDFSQTRNLILASVILVIGIGGAELHIGSFNVSGMPLATLIGIVLNLILPTAQEETGPAPAGEPEDRAQAAHEASPAKAAAGGR